MLWSWAGAKTLSEIATFGPSLPEECRFTCEVDRREVTEVIEIIDVAPAAEKIIKGVPKWGD